MTSSREGDTTSGIGHENPISFPPRNRILDRLRCERRNELLTAGGAILTGDVVIPLLADVLATLTGNWWAIPLIHLIGHLSPIIGGGVGGWHLGGALATHMEIR